MKLKSCTILACALTYLFVDPHYILRAAKHLVFVMCTLLSFDIYVCVFIFLLDTSLYSSI